MPLTLRPFLLFALAALACGTAQAQEEAAHAEFVYEFDPYYTNAGYNIPLTDRPIPTIESGSEAVIYRELIKDSVLPRYMTVEASLYPMPIMGTWLKTHHRGFYDSAAIGKNFNIIESLTAGFQEPWAVSVFFGNVAKLKRPGEQRIGNNYGYTGYLLSAGEKHIKNNMLVEDHWFELEWKIKGQLDYTDKKLSWSFLDLVLELELPAFQIRDRQVVGRAMSHRIGEFLLEHVVLALKFLDVGLHGHKVWFSQFYESCNIGDGASRCRGARSAVSRRRHLYRRDDSPVEMPGCMPQDRQRHQ
jgi:hypothetical protein